MNIPERGVSKKARIDLLMAEQQRLVALLEAKGVDVNARPDPDLETTPETAALFDEKLVNTIIETDGRVLMAFDKLGYAITVRDRKEREAVVRRVLSRPGIAQRIQSRWGEIERHKSPIIARMARVARYSASEENALQAATFLAKVGGWFAAEKREVLTGNASAFEQMRRALDAMDHQPGEAIAIDDTEKVGKHR